MFVLSASILLLSAKILTVEASLSSAASQQVSNLKELVEFLKVEADLSRRDIEKGIVHIGLADVENLLKAKVEVVKTTKPECVKDTETVAKNIVSEVGDFIKKCFAKIEGKLENLSKMADNVKTNSDADEFTIALTKYYDKRTSQIETCTLPAAEVMKKRKDAEETRIDNCVKGVNPTDKTDVTNPKGDDKSDSDVKLPSETAKVTYILMFPLMSPYYGCGCRRKPKRPKLMNQYMFGVNLF